MLIFTSGVSEPTHIWFPQQWAHICEYCFKFYAKETAYTDKCYHPVLYNNFTFLEKLLYTTEKICDRRKNVLQKRYYWCFKYCKTLLIITYPRNSCEMLVNPTNVQPNKLRGLTFIFVYKSVSTNLTFVDNSKHIL